MVNTLEWLLDRKKKGKTTISLAEFNTAVGSNSWADEGEDGAFLGIFLLHLLQILEFLLIVVTFRDYVLAANCPKSAQYG
jgi:hypothetical protein